MERIFVHIPFSMLDERFSKMLSLGIQPEIYFSGDMLDNMDDDFLKYVASSLSRNNLRCTVHAPFFDLPLGAVDAFVREAVVERYRSFVTVVELLKPVRMVIHTGYDRWRYSSNRDVWLSNACDMLEDLLEMFPEDTIIAVENVFDEAPDVLYELVNVFDERVGICFDVGHFHLFSKASLQEWLLRLGDRIVELHLHDNDGREDRHWGFGKGSAPVFSLIEWSLGRENVMLTVEAHTEKEALESFTILRRLMAS